MPQKVKIEMGAPSRKQPAAKAFSGAVSNPDSKALA